MNTLELLEYFIDGTTLKSFELLFLNDLKFIKEQEKGAWTLTELGYNTLKNLRISN